MRGKPCGPGGGAGSLADTPPPTRSQFQNHGESPMIRWNIGRAAASTFFVHYEPWLHATAQGSECGGAAGCDVRATTNGIGPLWDSAA
jgi:hypothetical protein